MTNLCSQQHYFSRFQEDPQVLISCLNYCNEVVYTVYQNLTERQLRREKEGFNGKLRFTWWIFIVLTSPMELRVVVIEIRVDDGIMGESPRHTGIGCHSAFVPLNCLYMCRFFSLNLSCRTEILWPSPTFQFSNFHSGSLYLLLFFLFFFSDSPWSS